MHLKRPCPPVHLWTWSGGSTSPLCHLSCISSGRLSSMSSCRCCWKFLHVASRLLLELSPYLDAPWMNGTVCDMSTFNMSPKLKLGLLRSKALLQSAALASRPRWHHHFVRCCGLSSLIFFNGRCIAELMCPEWQTMTLLYVQASNCCKTKFGCAS